MTKVKILSVAELRSKNPEDLGNYKTEVFKARLQAPTDFDREAYTNELERITSIQNEYEASEDNRFVQLKQEIQQTIDLAVEVTA